MNRTKLKAYAPQARRDFIEAITNQAAFFGLTASDVKPVEVKGDIAFIGGQAFARSVVSKRASLVERIARHGFAATMEAIAYTWFNRLTAIRFMELHGYLDHGFRVLSHPEGKPMPEILEQAEHVSLPGLDPVRVLELKLDGTQDAELYRRLLIAQCNALHQAMPFLFERIDDETELLLPDNLLHSDSIIRKLVTEIDEADWQEVEIIGWLYQFYISEKKDEVIGKVVKSEDIPAATQLFTPNWIVKYMVQNSVGRMWLATYPESSLRAQMEYYIQPAEQSPDVSAQLAAITPTTLNPESLTVLDPACGSGHILVEAYDVLKAIYLERGYRLRDIPRLILEKNLFGLDIDDRAAQLAGFALLMKARQDDRRILQTPPRLNVLAIQELTEETTKYTKYTKENQKAEETTEYTENTEKNQNQPFSLPFELPNAEPGTRNPEPGTLLGLFRHAKTFGSLIRIPAAIAAQLPQLTEYIEKLKASGDMFEVAAAHQLEPFVRQAELLARKYDCVVANPPYLGGKGMNPDFKTFAKNNFPVNKSDVFAMFFERNLQNSKPGGYLSFVSPYVWMFISSYESLRELFISHTTFGSLIQLEYNAFEPACVPVCTFTLFNKNIPDYKGDFIKLSDFKGHQNQAPKTLEAIQNPNCGWRYQASASDFRKIPGSPIAYWVSNSIRELFKKANPLSEIASIACGLFTCDNKRFLRLWFEVNLTLTNITLQANPGILGGIKYVTHIKGGDFRKWFGNNSWLVMFRNNGEDIRQNRLQAGQSYTLPGEEFYFQKGISWSLISSSFFGVRVFEKGSTFDISGCSIFPSDNIFNLVVGFLCSKLAFDLLKAMNPTLNFPPGTVGRLPFSILLLNKVSHQVEKVVISATTLSKIDWNSFETSWDFQTFPMLTAGLYAGTVKQSFLNWEAQCQANIKRMQELETENNRLFIEAYGLQDELTPDVPEDQITLARADQTEDVKRLISYAIGVRIGRYRLDKPGLIYAHSGNKDFEAIYKAEEFNHGIHGIHGKKTEETNPELPWFEPDDDGIIPLTDIEWFEDDGATHLVNFIATAWPRETLEDNLAFIAESLGANRDESPRDTIRRYLTTGFYKDHLRTYKRRPIYWLFSSGKLRAFQCLVYLHRYHEGTLARMRTEYVIPLLGKLNARLERLREEVTLASSTPARKKLQKDVDTLGKQLGELRTFEEKLRHYADMRLSLDLDDGVKVNYGKFGDLLADVKAVTGGSDE